MLLLVIIFNNCRISPELGSDVVSVCSFDLGVIQCFAFIDLYGR